ncbi:MAG: hypothetical protein ACYDDO_12310 [Acidiferrobacterales bacterium]
MTEGTTGTAAAIQQVLQELNDASFVAHRDTLLALPALEGFGETPTLAWLETCRDLFFHDRDAGKAFIRGSAAAAGAAGSMQPWTTQAREFLRWRGSWKALEGFMSAFAAALGSLGADGEARWFELGLQWCAPHLESGIAYFGTSVEALSAGQGIAAIEQLLAPARELFDERRLGLAIYLPGAIRVRDLLGSAAIRPWARRGADIMHAGRTRGEAFFRLESEESVALVLENAPGFRLPQHIRLLNLVLIAWYDESFELADSSWSPDQGRAFVETDGRSLFVPAAQPTREEALLSVIHVAGHLVFDSYERRNIEELFDAAGCRHPPLDDDQRITWRPLFARYGADLARFQLIFDICEDLRIDARIQARVPNYLRRLEAEALARGLPAGPARDYYAFALEILRAVLEMRSLDARLMPLVDATATVVDAFRIANLIYADTSLPAISLGERAACYLPGRSPNAARPVYPRARLDRAQAGTGLLDAEDVLKNTQINPNPDHREIPKTVQGDDPDFDIPPEDTSGSGGRVGVGIPQAAQVTGQARGAGLHERGIAYPEWDYRDGRYKRRWAWVQEHALLEADGAEASRLLARHAAALRRLKRAVQTQRPVRMAPKRRRFDGEDLDMEATLDFVVERRAGMSPQPAIYRQRVLQQRDTAVLLLADLSTSIMQRDPDGAGRVIDRIRAGMLLFAEALEEIGDPCCIAGFASKHRDNVSFYPIKEFEERLTPAVRATLGGLSGRLATRMGAAIRHATARFREVASRRRLMLILSDGRPADYDDGGDEKYLHEDTRMAVKEAVDSAVHPFCITLDAAGGAYLPQIFGHGHYLVLDRLDDLPAKLPEIYLRLKR